MPETNKSLRYRVNVSQTSTGKKSWDCTVELSGELGEPITLEQQVLALSDSLVEELTRRYPPEIKEK